MKPHLTQIKVGLISQFGLIFQFESVFIQIVNTPICVDEKLFGTRV